MAIKKSDLYSSLWASCDELRGGTAPGFDSQPSTIIRSGCPKRIQIETPNLLKTRLGD